MKAISLNIDKKLVIPDLYSKIYDHLDCFNEGGIVKFNASRTAFELEYSNVSKLEQDGNIIKITIITCEKVPDVVLKYNLQELSKFIREKCALNDQ